MQPVEITMMRALKVWWSFVWRVWVIMIPAMFGLIIVGVVIFFLMGGTRMITDGKFDPKNPMIGGAAMVLIYLVWLPIVFALQVYALKLALKVRWSDFHFVPVANSPSDVPPQVS